MSRSKSYSGYRSFQYLTAGADYRTFGLADEVNRVEPFRVSLNEPEERRFQDLLDSTVLISLH